MARAAAVADTIMPPLEEAVALPNEHLTASESNATRVDNRNSPETELALQDKFAHTRGKRKRTSRDDFVVLEGEYHRNPKPDKATRTAIVGRVSLSEKEVQIWFQNRRQMTRRKCRTWQPNEITSIIRSSQEQNASETSHQAPTVLESVDAATSTDSFYSQTRERSTSCSSLRLHEQAGKLSPDASNFSCSSTQVFTQESGSEPEGKGNNTLSKSNRASDSVPGELDAVGDRQPSPAAGHSNAQQDSSPSGAPGDLTNKSGLKRKSSAVRLSLSFDGKAKVLLGSESPSPPKKPTLNDSRAARMGPLQRSQSAVSPSIEPEQPLGVDVPEWRRPRAPGRSRDARAWEFYCDSDARNALTKTAEHDQKGSAQAVLGLIRSGSNSRKPLTPIRRENLSLQRADSSSKKTTATQVLSRAKLSRSMSSLARLQTAPKVEQANKPQKTKLGRDTEVWQDNFGDSDKENQDPAEDEDLENSTKSVNIDTPSSGGSLASSLVGSIETKGRQGRLQLEGDDVHVPSRHSREVDELNAVQNLLRLRQGEWR